MILLSQAEGVVAEAQWDGAQFRGTLRICLNHSFDPPCKNSIKSKSSIQELERLFEEETNNPEVLLTLQEGLTSRKTERAGRLRNRVRERLVRLKSGPSSGEQKSPTLPRPVPSSSQ